MVAAALSLGLPLGRSQTSRMQHGNWSTEAGLPQNSVHQILQTSDGYLWLATEGGVARFDGVSFKVFRVENEPALTSNDVSSLAQDKAGTLWIGTADGLFSISRTALLKSVPRGTLRRWGERDGLPSPSVLALAPADDGSLLILTASGLARFDAGSIKPLSVGDADITGLEREPDGSVLLLTSSASFLFQNGKFLPLKTPSPLQGGSIRGMQSQSRGGTWTWSDHRVVFKSAAREQQWQTGQSLPGSRLNTVFVDRTGTAWIGTNRGLVTVTPSSPQVSAVPPLGVNGILSITEDAEGNIWVGTETSGLYALRPRKFHGEPALADEEVSALAQAPNGTIWIGTRDDGLRRVRSGLASGPAVDTPAKNQALTSPVILSLAAGTNGDVWAGTPDGLTHIQSDGKAVQYTSSGSGLPDDLVRSLLVQPDGTVWAGTRRGLARFQHNRWDVFTNADGLGSDLIGLLSENPYTPELWIGTLSGLSVLRHGRFQTYGRSDGLTSTLVTGLDWESPHRLWVATRDAGLFLFDGTRFAPVAAPLLPKELLGVIVDREGFLWLRGPHGVVRGSTAELAACAAGPPCKASLGLFGTEDGMPSEEAVPNGEPSILRTASGEIWFATRKGVAVASPQTLAFNNVPPPVVLQRFLADEEEIPLGTPDPVIRSGHSRYTFDYAGLSYTAPSKVLYRFRLAGFDNTWSEPSPKRSASYTNLPPGRYTFQVQAANNDGVWNDTGVSFSFRILPPFYRRWWFILALLLVLAAGVIGLYRLRVRRLRRGFDAVLMERNRIAREIHDTLAQDMVAVSLQMDLVSQFIARDSISEATEQLKATRSLVKLGLEEARQSIWNLRADTRQNSLPSRITAMMKRFAGDALKVKLKIGGVYRDLPATLEDQVLRIAQEAVSNVSRHAEASSVRIQLFYEQDKLTLTVEDDGQGFLVEDATTSPGHFGLKGMRERAEALHAELDVTSKVGHGSTVKLMVPLAHEVKGSPHV